MIIAILTTNALLCAGAARAYLGPLNIFEYTLTALLSPLLLAGFVMYQLNKLRI